MTSVAKNTVLKFLQDIGRALERYHDKVMVDLPCKKVQVDEIWAFCYAKQKNVPAELQGQFGYGDVSTWVAIDADTKLVPSWLVGKRDADWAEMFMYDDLSQRLKYRVQLTTDGHRPYLSAVEDAFGSDIDYATLVKMYGKNKKDKQPETRYSPSDIVGCQLWVIQGKPDPRYISTSYIERENLTMRMQMRRFTGLTNAFSKKVENLHYAVALHFMHYNFCRIHRSLRVTPAIAAGISDYLWELEDIVELLEKKEKRVG